MPDGCGWSAPFPGRFAPPQARCSKGQPILQKAGWAAGPDWMGPSKGTICLYSWDKHFESRASPRLFWTLSRFSCALSGDCFVVTVRETAIVIRQYHPTSVKNSALITPAVCVAPASYSGSQPEHREWLKLLLDFRRVRTAVTNNGNHHSYIRVSSRNSATTTWWNVVKFHV